MASKNKLVPTKNLAVLDTSSTTPGNLTGQNADQKNGVILPSAARAAATYTTDEYFAPDVNGLRLYIDITNANGGTVTVTVQGKDPVTGNWVAIGTSAALNSNATTIFTIAPGVTETANVDIGDPLPVSWRLSVVVGTAIVTFSIGGEYLAA